MVQRRLISVRGIVQGVGFRPFVYGLAARLRLGGFVRNQNGSVLVEIEGECDDVERFVQELRTRPPPLSRIYDVQSRAIELRGESHFEIKHSESDAPADVCISPDVASCDDCIAEMFDPNNRRYRYPFTNCTNCGPRLTIIKGAPYDRALTTMAGFPMCADCRAEYENPLDRRFHAQPIACAACGPMLALVDNKGQPIAGDPLEGAIAALREGKIVAIKGLGGFHLACDVRNEAAVRMLRGRKHRDEKPFAVMARDLTAAEALCEINDAERRILTSAARPIVLLRRRTNAAVAESVAPRGNPYLGVMLPYTPLHHLLLHDLGDSALVMTSGNRSDEPIAYRDEDALDRLAPIADVVLTHNRPIHVRCDDSVMQVIGEREAPIRRSRGYAPQPVELPVECREPILAVGGQLKSTFALGRGKQAIVSHHLGDLDHLSAFDAFARDIELYERSFAIEPKVIVHDLHPDYASTRYAVRRAEADGVRLFAVQHHHAHMASCMAEHGLSETVIGVCFDGTGFGTDGTIWGGEFLVGDLRDFRRAAHLRYVPMPGGEKAIKEPWRMAVAHCADAGLECPAGLVQRIDSQALRMARLAMEKGLNSPKTSSMGRLFDAVASLAGVRDRVEFEGQAAIELQWLAEQRADELVNSYPFSREATQIDPRPIVSGVVDDVLRRVDPATIAARFHATVCRMIVDTCADICGLTGIRKVVLSGGVFMNAILAESVEKELSARGFSPFRHERVPANDGGISYGQLAVVAARLATS